MKYDIHRQTPEGDVLVTCDWDLTSTGYEGAIPIFQSDFIEKESFKVVYAGSTDDIELSDDDLDSIDSSKMDCRHRDMLVRERAQLFREAEEKREEAIRQIGRKTYEEMYPFLKEKVESDEILEMEQEDLNTFMLSKISMERITVMNLLYQILFLEIRITKCDEGIKAIESVLSS